MDQLERQKAVCELYGTEFDLPHPDHIVGIALDVFDSSTTIINGLRHPPEADTCGWYIWAGEEFSEDDDFFEPIHFSHIVERLQLVLPYMALPPGWRFLIAGEYEDIWYDYKLSDI